MDDPFDQVDGPLGADDIPNVNLIDDDTSGPDNRGSGSIVGTHGPIFTDACGPAILTMTVCMQPGDNYRAAASVIDDVFSGSFLQVDQADADAKQYDHSGNWDGYEVPAVWSKMLTVWRKLTIEVDSMGQESQVFSERFNAGFEHDQCEVGSISVDDPAAGFTTVYCTDNDGHGAGYAGIDFFEGGAFVRGDTGAEFLIVRSHLETSNVVVLWGNPGPDVVGLMCTLRDDDPYFPAGPRQLPKTTVLDNNITTAYGDAYIDIVEADTAANPNRVVPWLSNLSGTGLSFDYFWGIGVASMKDIGSSATFWARHLLVCYQAGAVEDWDSDGWENGWISENVLLHSQAPYPNQALGNLSDTMDAGGLSGVSVFVWPWSAMSTVYVEPIRDKDIDADTAKFWQYVAHEIGHGTFDTGGSRKSESDEHAEGALMIEGPALQNLDTMRRFSSETLVRFREVGEW